MKTKAKELTLKSLSIIELNIDLLDKIHGGWDTKTNVDVAISRTTTSAACATSQTIVTTRGN